MTSAFKSIVLGLGLAAGGFQTAALADDATAAVFGERQLALAVDARCHLFTGAQRNALDAARLQARGLLLREGISLHALDDYAAELHGQAAGIACNDTAVADLQTRVVEAYAAWSRIPEMAFPGAHFTWSANRYAQPDQPAWAIRQDQGDLIVGVSSRGGRDRRLSLALPQPAGATSAILVLRDIDRQPALYDATMGGAYAGPSTAVWARWTPPRFAETRIWASGRANSATAMALTENSEATVFDFPMSAADALAARDPREAARIDLMDRNGRIIASHFIEIGDFAAALAFLRGGDRPDMPS